MSRRLVGTVSALVALAVIACDQPPNEPQRLSATDQFAAALRGILVFEYEREADAAAEAANVRSDGQPSRTSLITWVATPRFYRQGRLIALYVGCDARILGALQNVAGPPFVVGSTPCALSGL